MVQFHWPTHPVQPPSARKRAVATLRARRHASPARAVPASSPFSAVDLLHDIDFEIALGHKLLELGILGFELAKAFDIGGLQLAQALAPGVDGLLAELMLLRNFGHLDCDRLLAGWPPSVLR